MIDLAENLQRSAKKLLFNPSTKAVQDYVHDSVELIGKLINEFVALKAEKKLLDAEIKHVHGDFAYCQELNAELLIERDQLKAKLAEIEKQEEPIKWQSTTEVYTPYITQSRYEKLRPEFQKWYKPYVAVQQSPAVAVPEEETNFCALKSITDSQVNAVARAFWRRIYAYRNDYGIELPKPLPVEFMAHMATALTWVDKEPSTRITEQDAREIAEAYNDYPHNFTSWLKAEGRTLLAKLNGGIDV